MKWWMVLFVVILLAFCLAGCGVEEQEEARDSISHSGSEAAEESQSEETLSGEQDADLRTESREVDNSQPGESALGYVTEGTKKYRGFVVDNVFHSVNEGEIHYNVYIPESYDGSCPYALYFTLPGYEGLYFQGVAVNLQAEEFGFEAQKYNSEMIIVAPQLSDWRETSANQTIALLEYFLEQYNIYCTSDRFAVMVI